MKSLLQFAALALLCVCAYAQTPANQASDDTVVVGNTSQPVQWEHRNDIQAAILRAGPNGTVWIPAGYKGTDCNPVSTCNPGTTKIIDWRSGGGTTGVVTGTPNQITVNSNQVGDANPKILPGALIANGPVGINSSGVIYFVPVPLCDFEGQSNQDVFMDLLNIGPVFNGGDGSECLAFQLNKIQLGGYANGGFTTYHAAAGRFEPPLNVTITDNNVSTPAVTVPGAAGGDYVKADGTGAGTPAGTVANQQKGFATCGNTTSSTLCNSPAFVDTALYPGAPDVCLQLKNTMTALMTANSSAFQIVWTMPSKAFCGTDPAVSQAHGDVYVVGNASRVRLYTSVTWTGFSSGIHFHGPGNTGVTNTGASNFQLVACNPLLHDNSFPGNAAGATCAAYFNSTTNMPQATVSSITAAAGSPSASTITLTGVLSGTPPQSFAGRLLCIGKENATELAANNGAAACYEINAEPTGGGTVFVVNSTNLVSCPAACGGKVYLDTPMIDLHINATGSTSFFVQFSDFTVDCAYVYACANLVNGADQEGSRFNNMQLFNATAYGVRFFVGNNPTIGTGGAYSGNGGAGSHSGPNGPFWFNYQSEDCEIAAGCPGTDGTHTGAGFLEPIGTLMACGNNQVLAANQAIIAYSSTVAVSTCQRNFAGLVSDGIAMGTNTQSFFGVTGVTISCKDVFNTGGHVEMPEILNGIGMFFAGPTQSVIGSHVEFCTGAVAINGDATMNETWIEDGSTPMQGLSIISGDYNNCSNPATGHPVTQWCIDLGAAQGTSNVMNVSIKNLSISPGTRAVQNQLIVGHNCTTATDKTIDYEFQEMTSPTGGAEIHSDCSTSAGNQNQAVFPQGVQVLAVPFATLNACAAALEGTVTTVTDSTVNTWGTTITGGGANHVQAYCDGTNWTVTGK